MGYLLHINLLILGLCSLLNKIKNIYGRDSLIPVFLFMRDRQEGKFKYSPSPLIALRVLQDCHGKSGHFSGECRRNWSIITLKCREIAFPVLGQKRPQKVSRRNSCSCLAFYISNLLLLTIFQ